MRISISMATEAQKIDGTNNIQCMDMEMDMEVMIILLDLT